MPKRNLAWILVIVMIALLMWQLPQTIAVRDSVYKAFGPLVEARSQIHKRFADDVPDAALTDAAVDAGIRAMISTLHDPHALYLNKDEYRRFQDRTDGFFGGVGVDVWKVKGGLEVLSRAPNSPAATAKILPGDIITHIDDTPAETLSLVDAVNHYLNGPPNTEVTLTVITPSEPKAEPRDVVLKRTRIDFGPVRGWARSPDGGWIYMLDPEAKIGYVRLTKFMSDVDTEMNKAIQELLRHDIRGLVLDLRDNTGGLFDQAIAVADRFLDGGLIVSKSGRKTDAMEWFANEAGTYPHFEMVVLVNASTASAAEIVSGALRDHERAIVVGERTYGKGSVQEVVPLKQNEGAIKLTTAHYYLPNGECIHKTPEAAKNGTWGLAPTHPVPLTPEQEKAWRDVRREISREPVVETQEDDEETPTTGSNGEQEPDTHTPQLATKLLAADLQLSEALRLLHEQLDIATQSADGSAATVHSESETTQTGHAQPEPPTD